MHMEKTFDEKYIKSISIYISLSFMLILFVVLFSDKLYGIFGEQNYTAVHLLSEIFTIIVAMSIAMQLWLTSRFKLINVDVYMGALFLSLAILAIFHTISYKGMPFFIIESSPYQATWFYIITRLLISVGLLCIVLMKAKSITTIHRNIVFLISMILTFAFICVIYLPDKVLPPLVIEGMGTTLLKNTMQYFSLGTQIVLIIILLKQFNLAPKRSLLFIAASIYIIISDIFFTTYRDVYDIYNFTGHLFQLFTYVAILKAVYYTTVEFPFISMIKANDHLESSRKEMHHMAYYDEITKLPNERFLIESINKSFTENLEQKTVLVLEFDRILAIKSSLGSFYSEQILKMAAERITEIVGEKYFVSKLRIDQFVIFIKSHKDKEEIMALCKQLQLSMSKPFHIQHFSLTGNLNIGIAHYPMDSTSSENLIKHAQFAMYEAGKVPERILSYESSMLNARTKRVELENDLYKALEEDQLFLQYQPQLNIQTGEINSMEALVRWNHPIKGWISPADFIPIAEESGLIIPFGRYVLETACKQTVELQKVINKPIKVAVNLSVGQLFQENFIDIIKEVIQETKIPPHQLELEITESMTMNTNYITPILKGLKEIGLTVAIDDFGTGYSSLSYLKDLPIDCLKIDRSFVQKISNKDDQEPLVDMIISMAQHLKLDVVAEGIETIEQLHYLNEKKCDFIQGYYISKPINIEDLSERFNEIEQFALETIQGMKMT
ncbi:EAL domain-containing protein [Lysinibacillus antri]|uniref:EAL domain-containing protein n=2 Tax=Lysinibacillus antri TaxID=2498145 RepID=A0A432L9L4_9BACI|nr:EAL domain-containing protein [Lysinibacillus antri]